MPKLAPVLERVNIKEEAEDNVTNSTPKLRKYSRGALKTYILLKSGGSTETRCSQTASVLGSCTGIRRRVTIAESNANQESEHAPLSLWRPTLAPVIATKLEIMYAGHASNVPLQVEDGDACRLLAGCRCSRMKTTTVLYSLAPLFRSNFGPRDPLADIGSLSQVAKISLVWLQ